MIRIPWETALLLACLSVPASADPGAPPEPGAPAVTNPHGNLKTECEACHTAKSWKTLRKPIRFQHATTGFPLEGRHASAACVACHRSLEFAHVATSCNDCHHDIHEGKSGTRCQDCHTTASWSSRSAAIAQHSKTGFPLRGVHALVECARCHVGSGEASRAPVSRDCYPCHTTEYISTQSPNHVSAGISVRCEDCHTTYAWRPAKIYHDLFFFRIYSGKHAGKWSACTICHQNSANYGEFTCLSCHKHDQEPTDLKHANRPGYVYDSNACYACHGRV